VLGNTGREICSHVEVLKFNVSEMRNSDIWTSLIKKLTNLSSVREDDECNTPLRTENVT